MVNGAYFISSGEEVEAKYEKAYSVEPKSANFIDQLTMNAGVFGSRRHNLGRWSAGNNSEGYDFGDSSYDDLDDYDEDWQVVCFEVLAFRFLTSKHWSEKSINFTKYSRERRQIIKGMAKLNFFILITLTMLVVLLIGVAVAAFAGDEGSHGTDKNRIKEKWTFTTSTTSALGSRFLLGPTVCHDVVCGTDAFPADRCDQYDDCGDCKLKDNHCYDTNEAR